MFRIICLLIGYAFGSFQTAYIMGRVTKDIDIREHGSKNAGMTNATRVLGRNIGLTVFVIDIFKAVLAYLIAAWIFNDNGILPGLYAGFGTVLGHDFPVLLKFKGGKGISSSIGTYGAADWRAACVTFIIGIAAVAATRFISLASLLITLSAPVAFWFFGYGIEEIIILSVMAVIAWVLHRGNIKRLLTGTERKFSLKKK
jgi:glycerol-3-phosphate acyltransferase PlsY